MEKLNKDNVSIGDLLITTDKEGERFVVKVISEDSLAPGNFRGEVIHKESIDHNLYWEVGNIYIFGYKWFERYSKKDVLWKIY